MVDTIKTLVLDLDIDTFDKCDIELLILKEYDNIQEQKRAKLKNKELQPCVETPETPKNVDSTKAIPDETTVQLAWDYKDAYNAYNSIERHIHFSETLYNLNKRGHYLLDEIRRTKYPPAPVHLDQTDIDPLVDSVVYSIVSTVRARLMGTSTLMNELYCYLEEVMFYDVDSSGIEEFYIDDDAFPLTALYYSQESWLNELDVQQVQFTVDKQLDEGEVMMCICFFNDYQNLLEKIGEILDMRGGIAGYSDSHKRLEYTTGKIGGIIERVKANLLEKINAVFSIN